MTIDRALKACSARRADSAPEFPERDRTAVCAPSDAYQYDEPIKAHWGWTHSRQTALCGARLIGVFAPASHPFVCEECEELHQEFLRERGPAS